MSVRLDCTQRINLHALIGQQRASVDDMRIFWRLQDRIELSPDEKEAIGYKIQQAPNGQSGITWDTTRAFVSQEYDFSPDEIQKLLNVVKTWQPGYTIGADRVWLEPLLSQLEQSPNGQPK